MAMTRSFFIVRLIRQEPVPGKDLARFVPGTAKPVGFSIGIAMLRRDAADLLEDLMGRASMIMARVDSIRALVGSDQHSLGRFRRDSTLVIEIRNARVELAEVRRLASSPNGTIGRFRMDSIIIRNIHRDLAEVDSLIADVKKHPLRYIAF